MWFYTEFAFYFLTTLFRFQCHRKELLLMFVHRWRSRHIFGGAKEFLRAKEFLPRFSQICQKNIWPPRNRILPGYSPNKNFWGYPASYTSVFVARIKTKLELLNACPVLGWAWASAEILPWGGNVDILHIFFRLLMMQCRWTFTKRFNLSIPQKWPML